MPWLVKQEPSAYPFAQLVADGRTTWDGVRNSTARIHLRAMKVGDGVLYYHSGDERAVVGLAEVVRGPHPDPKDPAWVAVEIAPKSALPRPVTLAEIKAEPALADMPLIRMSRLSVMPVTAAEWKRILALGKSPAKR